ncbi:kinase-like domain-containing protein, partial [Coniochaeta sp. 2T2.1]
RQIQRIPPSVSDNPYRTSTDTADTEQQTVVRGILLEYHPNGSLEEALLTAEMRQTLPAADTNAQTPQEKRPWRRWAVHVAHGLQSLHAQGLAHPDLKPANVVISGAGKAVIIDISGWAGTHEYLAPEVRDVFNLSQLGLEVQVKNDCWALGRLFERMAF